MEYLRKIWGGGKGKETPNSHEKEGNGGGERPPSALFEILDLPSSTLYSRSPEPSVLKPLPGAYP